MTTSIVYFEANENYFKGVPADQERSVQGRRLTTDKHPGRRHRHPGPRRSFLQFSTAVDEIEGYNSNGELDRRQDRHRYLVDNLGYGYIGINAETVNVGGEPALRSFQGSAQGSCHCDRRSTVRSPSTPTMASALPSSTTRSPTPPGLLPSPTDDGLQGCLLHRCGRQSDIYTADMTAEDKYAAALNAAV